MVFRSNLTAPDLYPAFAPRVVCKPRHNSLGHDVLSDIDDPLEAGFLTHDEAAILFNVAKSLRGSWSDIGSRYGWSTAHIYEAGRESYANGSERVLAVDPIYDPIEYEDLSRNRHIQRFHENTGATNIQLLQGTASKFFADAWGLWLSDGFCIDGDHCAPEPLNDAKGAVVHLRNPQRGAIVLHDALGGPVQDAVVWLLDNGFRARIYWTPHVMAVCWRGDFTPPDHVPDPQIEPKLRPQMAGFPFERCS